MLKKANRLSRAEFSHFFRSGKRHHSENLTIVAVPFSSFHGSVVVSKKVAKSAVTRNEIRRMVYGQLEGKKEGGGVWIVLVKPSFCDLTKQARRTETYKLIERIPKPA
jgi:ribonuclease P protein component